VSTLLKDDPAFVSQVCQFERDLGTQDVIAREDDVKRRLRQFGHCQLRIPRRVSDESQVKIGAQEVMGQIRRGFTLHSDIQRGEEGKSNGIEYVDKRRINVGRLPDLENGVGSSPSLVRGAHSPFAVGN